MKDSFSFSYLLPVGGVVALLMLSLMTYAGFLTADWGTLLAAAPAILATIGIVGGMLCGMFFFEAEQEETPEEAARPDGTALLEWLREATAEVLHRAAIRLHVRGLGP